MKALQAAARAALALRRTVVRQHHALALLAGSALVVGGVGMVAVPAAMILAGVLVIGLFGIEFRRPGA